MPKKDSIPKTLHLDFQLPVPIYKDSVTTNPVDPLNKTIVHVQSIEETTRGYAVTSTEGKTYHIPLNRVRYWTED